MKGIATDKFGKHPNRVIKCANWYWGLEHTKNQMYSTDVFTVKVTFSTPETKNEGK